MVVLVTLLLAIAALTDQPSPPDAPPVLLHIIEAARILALSRARVYQLIAAGELPHIRIGKSVRVPRAALLRYIERRIVDSDDNEAA